MPDEEGTGRKKTPRKSKTSITKDRKSSKKATKNFRNLSPLLVLVFSVALVFVVYLILNYKGDVDKPQGLNRILMVCC